MLKKIISGGQTGVDRAALDFALRAGIPCGGWCPKGRLAEDGVLDVRYPLKETPQSDYRYRTERNVRDSDGTLILYWERPTGGTSYTLECAKRWDKPFLTIDLTERWSQKRRNTFESWLKAYRIRILNVAGPRESHAPGKIYRKAKEILERLFDA
jgi:hypothetical protein